MTAEIVVMNPYGLALATDSAVTVGRRKVYNSAKKLFELTKHDPVGVMIYESVFLLNVPWETLIKICRNKLVDNRFDTLHEYMEAFLHFLNNNEYKEWIMKMNSLDIHYNQMFSVYIGIYRIYIWIYTVNMVN